MQRITPFIVMDILATARKIPGAIHMEVGEPDLPPPPAVREAFIQAIRDNRFHYTPACGLPELRERIARHYHEYYGVSVDPARVIVTAGTSGAFLIVFALLAQENRRLVLSDPSYPCYKNFAYFLHMEPHFVTVGRETDFEIPASVISDRRDLGALIISSPANPTGSIYSEESIKQLIEVCREKMAWFVSDEIYHGLVYDAKEHTALEFSDDAIVINSFSKCYCMPGIRVGWMILPERLLRQAEILIQNLYIATNTPAQYACLEAFDYPYLKIINDAFRQRRDFLYSELKECFEIDAKPQGAFYLWVKVARYSRDSLAFCGELLEKAGVAVTPGIDFGDRWTHYVRLAYTRDIAELAEGVRRLKGYLMR